MKTKPAVNVSDWLALDAAIDAFISESRLEDEAAEKYAQHWRIWESVCANEGVDPWDAPFEAFEALWTLRRKDGRLCAPSTVKNIATSISHYYRERGLVPAHTAPQHRADWSLLAKGATRARNRGPADGQRSGAAKAVPLSRQEVRALLAAPEPAVSVSRRAVYLLTLDGFGPTTLTRLTNADVVLAPQFGDGVTVAGRHVPCDHRERVRGVTHDCTACAVRKCVPFPEGPLFDPKAVANARNARLRLRRSSAAWERGEPLSTWEAAGWRRAMALSGSAPQGRRDQQHLRWVRAKAWLAVAWSCGLRMGADTDELTRANTVLNDNCGWSIRLGRSKDDPAGTKGVVRPFAWGQGVAELISEWACVRDAWMGSQQGPLFTSFMDIKRAGRITDTMQAASRDLNLLAELAGVAPRFTSYSPRKGFAAQATADGWQPEAIQEGLRHRHLTTTHTSYIPEKGSKQVANKFMEVILERTLPDG